VSDTNTLGAMTMMAPLTAALSSLGKSYGAQLQSRPILTKSVTAGLIFGLSDWTAQRLAKKSSKTERDTKLDWTRILTAAAVGLLYFGPAAHKWYETIFRLLPGTSLVSTLQKATLGQLIFGPSFTCIFFATSLMQGGTFTISNWFSKIKTDLPGAWVAGLGFWPLVDLFSYSVVPHQWIPLFVNSCSFFWTIYLSLIANKTSSTEKVA
jgi:protein Mpv17